MDYLSWDLLVWILKVSGFCTIYICKWILWLRINFEIVYFIYEIPAWIWLFCHCLRYMWNVYMWLFVKCYEKMKNEILCPKCYEKFEVWNVIFKAHWCLWIVIDQAISSYFLFEFWTIPTGLKLVLDRVNRVKVNNWMFRDRFWTLPWGCSGHRISSLS